MALSLQTPAHHECELGDVEGDGREGELVCAGARQAVHLGRVARLVLVQVREL